MAPSLGACPNPLAPTINARLARPDVASAHWGMVIQDLASGETLYERNGDQLFTPASSLKLLVTAAALRSLGADFRWQTPLYLQGAPPVLAELTLNAQGDPTLTTADLTKLARELRQRGVTVIETLTLADATPPQRRHPDSWEGGDLTYGYAPPVNQAILNGNQGTLTLTPQSLGQPLKLEVSDPLALETVSLINQTLTAPASEPLALTGVWGTSQWILTGALTPQAEPADLNFAVPDPGAYFLAVLRRELSQQGIEIRQERLVRDFTPSSAPGLILTSPPLGEIVARINQESDNLYAEALGRLLERRQLSLTPLGADFLLKDYSGLSRQNLVSPRLLIHLLREMTQTPSASVFRESLALMGERGTLRRRLGETPIAGKFWGKTGTLTGTVSLAGYWEISPQQTLGVAILVNNSRLGGGDLRRIIDELLLGILGRCQGFDLP
ncbi:MAG: D-alanyl-D-alanine carboxypeptidase/D-alanyl-D-alanine-endopeptidase [Cyanobacteriota bacterium]|jgi:D-alanyl-D-alanine carboxypeptidase/D-alanyl-D-alanine-endopeptidase (penicillin-binding protein 4)